MAPIKVVAVNVPKFKKGDLLSAELHQLVTTKSYYPAVKINNSLSINLFENSEFGEATEEQEFTAESDRVAFMFVPAGTTVEQVQERVNKMGDKAWIYRILSNNPILSAEHKSAIANGLTTKDIIAESQVVRYPKFERDGVTLHEFSEQLITDQNGKIQYRASYLTDTEKDMDLRTDDSNMYLTELLEQELHMGVSIPADSVVETNMQTA
jgi:hypothetical protein